MFTKKVVVYDVNPVHRGCQNDAVLDEAILPGGPPMRVRKEKKSWCLRVGCALGLILTFFLLATACSPFFREFLADIYQKKIEDGSSQKEDNLKVDHTLQEDWIFFPPTNSLYHVINGSNNWDECQQKCLSLSSHLTSVHSLPENEFISNLTAGYLKEGEEDSIWIGITLGEDGWKNVDKTKVDFFNWNWEEAESNEEMICVEMYSRISPENKGKWNMMDCSAKLKNCVCKRLPFSDSELSD